MKSFIILIITMVTISSALPQWPYRDENSYYGYQKSGGVGRGERSEESDDEIEIIRPRQDLKVADNKLQQQGQQPASSSPLISSPIVTPVVVETGSAKPVLTEIKGNSPAETKVNNPVQPPAFPPATPPSSSPPQSSPGEDESEEESEEEEAEEDEEEEEGSDEGRADFNHNLNNNSNINVEALVPGYVTNQGEVLVPFDTVVGDKNKVVAVLEDPEYPSDKPPVVILPSDNSSPLDNQGQIPRFFRPTSKQLYYSSVPPPGSIFTFDEERNENLNKRKLRSESSEEAEEDEEDEDVEERPVRVPLAYIKSSGGSGEDDEAESLGLRLARMRANNFYPSRTPQLFHRGNGFYTVRYPQQQSSSSLLYNNRRRPNYSNDYYEEEEPVLYFYRPASSQKVKVTPIANFQFSLEDDGQNITPVVSPFHYYKNKRGGVGGGGRRPTPVIKQRNTRTSKQIKKNLKKNFKQNKKY